MVRWNSTLSSEKRVSAGDPLDYLGLAWPVKRTTVYNLCHLSCFKKQDMNIEYGNQLKEDLALLTYIFMYRSCPCDGSGSVWVSDYRSLTVQGGWDLLRLAMDMWCTEIVRGECTHLFTVKSTWNQRWMINSRCFWSWNYNYRLGKLLRKTCGYMCCGVFIKVYIFTGSLEQGMQKQEFHAAFFNRRK